MPTCKHTKNAGRCSTFIVPKGSSNASGPPNFAEVQFSSSLPVGHTGRGWWELGVQQPLEESRNPYPFPHGHKTMGIKQRNNLICICNCYNGGWFEQQRGVSAPQGTDSHTSNLPLNYTTSNSQVQRFFYIKPKTRIPAHRNLGWENSQFPNMPQISTLSPCKCRFTH